MKLHTLDQNAQACKPALESCEACGAEFTCGVARGGCWCGEIELSAEVRARLAELYQRCLCRACLEKFAGASRADEL